MVYFGRNTYTRKNKKKNKGKNVRTKMRSRKVGGMISRTNFIEKDIGDYYSYAELCRDYLIPHLNINGYNCSSAIDSLELIFKGANGFALKFICRNGITYTVKLIFNNAQMFGTEETFARFEKREITNICKEFTSINKFDSIYIMKAYKYFMYNGTEFILSSQCGVPRRTDIERIPGNDVIQINTYNSGKQNPIFSGLILENIQKSLLSILTNKTILTKNNVLTLFLHYLRGLEVISDMSCIHKDIKPNNLMFNINEDGSVLGKIIDFGETYTLETVSDVAGFIAFNPSSVEYAPMTSDVLALQNIYNGPIATRSLTRAQGEIINEIKTKYDLYSLSKSFKVDLIPKIEGIDFTNFMETVLIPGSVEVYTERIDIDTAIALTLSLIE